MITQDKLIKCFWIHIFPGSWKTRTMIYITLYAISKGGICHKNINYGEISIQLGGEHQHHLFSANKKISTQNGRTGYWKIERDLEKLEVLTTLSIEM